MQLLLALVGAAGTVLSAYLVARVQKVQRTVNGHSARQDARIKQLDAEIRALRRRLDGDPPSGRSRII